MKINALIKLRILATQASSKEPVGPTLGQFGIPIMDFCNKFNTLTQKFINSAPLNVVIFYFGNQKYDFIIKLPNLTYFIKLIFEDKLSIKKPGYLIFPIDKLNYITPYMLYEILNYYYTNSSVENYILSIEYKKLFNSIKSNGLIFFNF